MFDALSSVRSFKDEGDRRLWTDLWEMNMLKFIKDLTISKACTEEVTHQHIFARALNLFKTFYFQAASCMHGFRQFICNFNKPEYSFHKTILELIKNY